MENTNKKILILNSRHDLNALFFFFKELSTLNSSLTLLSIDEKIIRKFKENNLPARKLYFWPVPGSFLYLLACLILSPLVMIYLTVRLIRFKHKYKIKYLLLFDSFDRIFTARAAKLIGLTPWFLVCPELADDTAGPRNFAALRTGKNYKTICLTDNSRKKLIADGFGQTVFLPPGIKLGLGHQDNIFSGLAKEKNRLPSKKFFTIGTILDLNKKHNLETIFQGIKNSQTVIRNIQFIIIGDGKERKNLLWLAKKMGLETILWFVGEQKCLKKWLQSLDVYAYAADQISLADINYSLLAMSSSLPIIMPGNSDLEEFALNFKQGMRLEQNNPDEWARLLIKLQQNKKLRLDLGASAKARVEERFTVERMAEDFLTML